MTSKSNMKYCQILRFKQLMNNDYCNLNSLWTGTMMGAERFLRLFIWKVALYDFIHDIIRLWYWLWYHMFWNVYDIIFLWWYHMSMISWFYIYDIIPQIRMISVTPDIIGLWYHNQYHIQNHIWYHEIKTMISYFWIYDISNSWYHRSMIS